MNRLSVSPPAVPPGGSPSDRRHFGASTDDAAIFLEDTMDRPTAQCISVSPSAVAILSPQRAPTSDDHVDVTEYDAAHIGSASKSSSGLHDVTNFSGAAVRLNFGKSPTPKSNHSHSSSAARSAQRLASLSASRHHPSHSATRLSHAASTPASKSVAGAETPGAHSAIEPTVSLADYERLERERNRFQKMYEHQKVLYEEMSEKHADTYQKLQDRIVEVVALSTRNEESKRFIRQLKKEMSESRTRVMNMQNRVLEDQRADRLDRGRYEAMLEEHERKYERMVERHETKMAGLESLLKDLTCIEDEHGAIHVSQLDSLLRASYAKSTALFSDLLRQGRQIDYFYDSKADLELQLDQLRKEKRDMEASIAEERRHMMYQTERFVEQIEEQQQSILSLRQMLIRTMACVEDEDGEMGSFGSHSSSFHSMSDEEEYAVEVDKDFADSARTARGSGSDGAPGQLVSHAVTRLARTPTSAAKTTGDAQSSACPTPTTLSSPSSAGDGAAESDNHSPGFLTERQRNCPARHSVVRHSTDQPEDTQVGGESSTTLSGSGGGRHARRSQGRPSGEPAARSIASLIATAGSQRSSTGSSGAAVSKAKPTDAVALGSGDRESGATSSVSMVRRKVDGLFAAPAERKGHGDADTHANATPSRSSGKKMDFSSALAAVAEIRERTRQARASAERKEDDASSDKENVHTTRRPATATTVKRHSAIKELAKSKPRAGSGTSEDDDEDDAVPRLTPHSRSRVNSHSGLGAGTSSGSKAGPSSNMTASADRQ